MGDLFAGKSINELINVVRNIDFREFWWDSRLLITCSMYHDHQLIQALVYRHHGLMNKQADSAHVIRQTIKVMDGPSFNALWECIKMENDPYSLAAHLDDYDSLPWGACFILGEVGGLYALQKADREFRDNKSHNQYLLIRMISQILIRYNEKPNMVNPMMTIFDINSGEQKLVPVDSQSDIYDRQKLRFNQENEYLLPIPHSLTHSLIQDIDKLPDIILNVPKSQLITFLSYVTDKFK